MSFTGVQPTVRIESVADKDKLVGTVVFDLVSATDIGLPVTDTKLD